MKEKDFIKRALLVALGTFLVAVSLHWFLIPANLAAGGISGIAIVVQYYFPQLPTGVIFTILNIFLLLLSFFVIGREFGGLTIFASLVLSGFLMTLEFLFPVHNVLVDDLFLNLIFGILISGMGMGITFNQNASTGGTDIVAKIINHFFGINIGASLFIVDVFIVIAAIVTFGLHIGMYALLGTIFNSLIIDQMIAGLSRKVSVMIITDEIEKIKKFIHRDLDRSGTLFKAVGMYREEERPVLMTIVSRSQYIQLKRYTREVDPFAFMIVNYIHKVEGEGFSFTR